MVHVVGRYVSGVQRVKKQFMLRKCLDTQSIDVGGIGRTVGKVNILNNKNT